MTALMNVNDCSAGAGWVLVSHAGEAEEVLAPVHQQQGAQEVRHLPHIPRHQLRQAATTTGNLQTHQVSSLSDPEAAV